MHFLWSMAPETPRNLCLQHLLFPDPSIPRSQAKRKYLLWSRRNLEGIGVQLMDSVGLAYCRSCDCAKGICGQVPMDTLGRHSMVNTQSTLHQHLGWHSVGSQLINCQLCIWVKTQMTLNCWSTEYRSGCQLSTDWDVDQGYQSRISIDTWLWIPLVHTILDYINTKI